MLATSNRLERRKRRVRLKLKNNLAKLMSERLNKLDNCKKFVFDRGPYKYIGVVAEFANELRSYGFEF
ncbi:50S ribosomal protein L18 [Ehrlichia ruminantium]|uniref:50S ribosomal protein L18 n=1 Tax=Ehrlichia ruminantium TaxID=779 RepID=UPI0007C103F7|nr:50S ribosomal protein L18 [Ehrlichia ruminantium]GAT75484.1 50S ribosomal protein L18 [Ehrlichia ruminantium]